MKVINFRDIYPHYTQDCFVEVTDEVVDLFSEFDRKVTGFGRSARKTQNPAYLRLVTIRAYSDLANCELSKVKRSPIPIKF